MDWLTFITEIVDALAWPAAILIIFFALRQRILDLIPLIERLRYRDLEIGFNRQVEQLAYDVRKLLPVGPRLEGEDLGWKEHLTELAVLSPRAVVLESWLELEKEAIETTRSFGLELSSREERTPILLGHALEQAGVLNEATQEIFYRLRNLRNAAAHASDLDFTPETALEYADLAQRFIEHLRAAQPA